MQVGQFIYTPQNGWQAHDAVPDNADLLLAFGSGDDCSGDILVSWWQSTYPNAQLVGCSTAGEIVDTQVASNSIVVTVLRFEHSSVQLSALHFAEGEDSYKVGEQLAQALPSENLKLCFVLSDGLNVNGTRLVDGLASQLPEDTLITGGLAGDGKRFAKTQVCVNHEFGPRRAVAVGLYGDNLEVGVGSLGGWSTFGPKRRITRANENVLFELDDRSALELYKTYLGEYAEELPSSGLRFPLRITTPQGKSFVRTLLAIDEQQGSMIFAGDVPEGATAQLMRSNVDSLIDGAQGAAQHARKVLPADPEIAILISCVGRKLVMDQRVEEEVEAVQEELGDQVTLCGYYSYGEICPLPDTGENTLHNQTMTITALREVATSDA